MDEKRRSKRKSMDDGFWDCSVCTYRNTPEAFKCDMCDVRKGTSTRKPRFNPQLAATQQVVQQFAPPPKKERTPRRDKEGKEVRDRDLDQDNDDSNFGEESIDTDQMSVNSHETEIDVPISQPERSPEPKSVEKEKPKAEPTTSSQTKEKKNSTPSTSQPRKHRTPRLKNIDRSSGTSMEVTVGGVTVVITDYKPKKEKNPTNNSNSTTAANADTLHQKDTPPESASKNGDLGSNNHPINEASRPDAVANQQTNGHIQMENKKR